MDSPAQGWRHLRGFTLHAKMRRVITRLVPLGRRRVNLSSNPSGGTGSLVVERDGAEGRETLDGWARGGTARPLVGRLAAAHNPKVASSNLAPATSFKAGLAYWQCLSLPN